MAPTSAICIRNRKDSETDEELKLLQLKLSSDTESHFRFGPLVVVFAGLPASGKTLLARKLERHLNWMGRKAKVFEGNFYRRKISQQGSYEISSIDVFDARRDASDFLKLGGKVAILDGVHAKKSTRHGIHEYFTSQCGFKVLFVECNVDDENILENNIREILRFNAGAQRKPTEDAVKDFKLKLDNYRKLYEPLDESEAHYSLVKVFNSGENLLTRHVRGPLQREASSFICSFQPTKKTLYFSRHGESEFNQLGKIGGDANLSGRGQLYAVALGRYFEEARIPDLHVWTSEKRRTKETAKRLNAPVEHVEALNELDAGVCEGLTYEEMQAKYPQEFAWRDQDKLRYRYPWGESYADIMSRLKPVLEELDAEDNLLVISHQAVLRCILGYFLNKRLEELPYINVPLHTIIKLTTNGYKYKMELIKLNVECVDTYRKQPQNCKLDSISNNIEVKTVLSHLDKLNSWLVNSTSMLEQH